MKKTSITSLVLATLALSYSIAYAGVDENTLNVSVKYIDGNTVASLSREVVRNNEYTGTVQSYKVGEFTKTYKGMLSPSTVAQKVSRLCDDFITVNAGGYKVQGRAYKLAGDRSKAFFANGYEGYFAELARQLAEEK